MKFSTREYNASLDNLRKAFADLHENMISFGFQDSVHLCIGGYAYGGRPPQLKLSISSSVGAHEVKIEGVDWSEVADVFMLQMHRARGLVEIAAAKVAIQIEPLRPAVKPSSDLDDEIPF